MKRSIKKRLIVIILVIAGVILGIHLHNEKKNADQEADEDWRNVHKVMITLPSDAVEIKVREGKKP
ncbi:hypothetical protein [Halalkalibacterium halodurans]|jgi:hypothetical protein|uniref:Uncharacterized protein n=1 Tax=Halalkalibacterium halodurans TaxID=86665 RepID=A0A0M0KH76_ALKHA|nr:hypothetical protein [Halalkalibacterium halodurans]TPE66543.1 hypothetical protein AMD02_018855 [Halalkalibacterium halodurans]